MTFFSKLGQDIILPQDVLIQSKETAAIPDAINATIGIATKNKKALFLPTIDRIIKELNNTDYLPYSPTPGLPEMRKLWKDKIIDDNPNINKDYLSLPMVTTGITQGMQLIYLAIKVMRYYCLIYFGKTTHKFTLLNLIIKYILINNLILIIILI